MICGFLLGFDCLGDFQGDEVIEAMFGEGMSAVRSLGVLLRDFEEEELGEFRL